MAKKKRYTIKEFKIFRAIAVFVIILAFVGYCIGYTPIITEMPFSFEFYYCVALILFMPLLIIISWYMCYERYVYLVLQTVEESERGTARHQIYTNVQVIIFWSVAIIVVLLHIVNYIEFRFEYIDKIYDCIVALAICLLSWFVCLMWYVQRGINGCLKQKIYKKKTFYLLAAVMIIGTLICVTYTYERGEDEWYWNMVEEANKELGIE